MKVLIAVKGSESQDFYRQIALLTVLRDADEVVLAHVVDLGPREHLEMGRGRFLEHRPLSHERALELTHVEEEHGRSALQSARRVLEQLGVPAERLHEVLLRGRANELLRDLADRESVDLVAVGGRRGKPGPHSIGKTARFLLDHCRCTALLVRTQPHE